MLPSKFGVSWPFRSAEEAKNRFSRWLPWRPSWISDRHDFNYFLSTPMLPSKFGVNWPVSSGEEVKNKFFQDGRYGGHRGFPIGKILAIFYLQVTPMLPSKFGLSVKEKKRKIDFQDGGHLGFPIETILAIGDLQVPLMLPTKYRVNWPRGEGGVGF